MTPAAPGHDPGHASPQGFSWGDHLAWLVERHGSLAAVAERLSALRGYADDAGSVERALRRLRSRGQQDGGAWGARALAAFGLPEAVDARARWMGAYHSRFTDLPVPLCQDLVRLWDRPPVSEAPSARVWLAVAHASCALRLADRSAAATHLRRARAVRGQAPPEARMELLLAEAFVASREDPALVPSLLAEAEPLLALEMPAHDRACLHARWVDQLAYERNKGRDGRAPDHADAEALYRSIAVDGAPSFARCRRANGLAYARWKQGHRDEGAALAREACRHAGDGGHLRLRAMALSMVARIVGGPEGAEARRRALAIAAELSDEGLRLRFAQGAEKSVASPHR
ncbi:MAG: hypothetical protein ABI134_18840 [Byssovorax sp.]